MGLLMMAVRRLMMTGRGQTSGIHAGAVRQCDQGRERGCGQEGQLLNAHQRCTSWHEHVEEDWTGLGCIAAGRRSRHLHGKISKDIITVKCMSFRRRYTYA